METYLKAVAAVFVAVVLCLVLTKQGKEFSMLLSVIVCCLVISAAISFFKPVFELMNRFSVLGQLNDQMLGILVKSVGIALLTEISELVCKDAGNGTLAKSVQILATSVILWLSIPLLNELMDLIEEIFACT